MAKQKFLFNPNIEQTPSEPGSLGITTPPSEIQTMVTQLDTKKERNPMEVKLIPRSKLISNKKNHYPIETTEALADSILHYGLQQPLTAIYVLAEDAYLLEAGHQRTSALDLLIHKYKDASDDPDYSLYEKNVKPFEHGYPCIVQDRLPDEIDFDSYYASDDSKLPESIIDSEIRLIVTNEIRRNDNPAVKAKNVARLATLYDLKNHGKAHSEKVNVNKQIAADLNITERQVATYKKLDSLIPELKEEFENHNISLKNSALIAKLEPEDQEQLLLLIRSGAALKTAEITTLIHEKEDLLKKIESKENKIEQLQAENHDERLGIKDDQIKALKQELANLKANEEKKPQISTQTSQIIKAEMALKAAFAGTESAIDTLETQLDSYLKNDFDDTEGFSFMTQDTINERCNQLISKLQALAK